MTSYKITTGPKAYSFNDQSTGITLVKSEVKELTPSQYNSRKIQKALISGHIRLIMEPKSPQKYTEEDITKLDNKLKKQFGKGLEPSKAAKAYSLEEAKLIAQKHDIEADAEDTVTTLIEAIFESYGSEEEA